MASGNACVVTRRCGLMRAPAPASPTASATSSGGARLGAAPKWRCRPPVPQFRPEVGSLPPPTTPPPRVQPPRAAKRVLSEPSPRPSKRMMGAAYTPHKRVAVRGVPASCATRAASGASPMKPLRRLRGKQAPPWAALARGSTLDSAAKSLAVAAPRRAHTKVVLPAAPSDGGDDSDEEVCWLGEVGHTLRPVELGEAVLVEGDGWGGGRGSYRATVVEADRYTYTVVASKCAPEPWKQAHVLRRCCTPIGSEGP